MNDKPAFSNQTRMTAPFPLNPWIRYSFGVLLACISFTPYLPAQQIIISKEDTSPKISGETTHRVLVIPESLIAGIRSHYPSYRLPTESDLTGQWAQRGAEPFPFIVWGSLTGSESIQVATILIREDAWMLVILEKRGARYDPVFIRGGTLNKSDSRIGSPQELSLQLLPKGQVKAISIGGKTLRYRFPFDAVLVTFLDQATYIIHFEKGEYEEISVVE